MWRADVLEAAWQAVRRNGGAAGVDGETVQRIEAQGVKRWLGELARDSPLFSNIYMRRFIVGWNVLGHARCFNAEIVNYADDFVVCGKAPADMMRGAVEDLMERLRLPINVTKTRSMRVPDEPLEFLGYRIGRNYRRDTGRAYIGTCPSRSSVVSVCRRISELTHRRYGLLDQGTVVRRLNRAMTGWARNFQLGQVSPAYRAVDAHAIRRLRRKHKVTEVTIAQGVADFAELAGVDDPGHVVGYGVDEGAETK